MSDRLGFSTKSFRHKLATRHLFLCRKSTNHFAALTNLSKSWSCAAYPITYLVGSRLCAVTSSAGDGYHRCTMYLHRQISRDFNSWMDFDRFALANQYDRQHRDANCHGGLVGVNFRLLRLLQRGSPTTQLMIF